jgi:hypothetical protein
MQLLSSCWVCNPRPFSRLPGGSHLPDLEAGKCDTYVYYVVHTDMQDVLG